MCPWDGLRDAYGAPNIDWCEASLCSWITEPANTWSNLAYLLVAFWLWRGQMRAFAAVVFTVGVMSFAYHASTTFALQVLDFFGMFMLLGLPVAINLRRLGVVQNGRIAYACFNLVMMCALFVMRAHGLRYQALVLVSILAVLLSEVFVTHPRSLKPLLVGVGFLAVAFVFSILDATRTWCEPDNHALQGHAIWHVMSALSQLGVARYYTFLDVSPPGG